MNTSLKAKRDKKYTMDLFNRELDDIKLLCPGDFFGEIRCIYDFPRTADIVSRTYNTLAELTYYSYLEIISEYPEFQKYLKQNIAKYDETDHK